MAIIPASLGSLAVTSPTITSISGDSATGSADSTKLWELSGTAGRVSGGVFSLQA